MGEKNVKIVSFTAGPEELRIIDAAQKENYQKNRSEVIRMLITAGGERMYGKQKKSASPKTNV